MISSPQSTEITSPESSSRARRPRRVLVFSSTFPSAVQPIHGVFVKERVRHVAALPECDVRVVSPVPLFPPLRWFKRWYPLSQISRCEQIDGLEVIHPRYPLLPKVGKFFHPASMARASYGAVSRLRQTFDFDLVDAHFVYPDGVAAAWLARRMNRPLIITGRGEDILTCPSDPALRTGIRQALASATQLVAVSGEIAEAMIAQGADPNKITVIPNGVDTEKFHPSSQAEARTRLGLPQDSPVVLSVGYRLERKGFHLLVEAVAKIRHHHPGVLLAIVGGPARWGQDYTREIEASIRWHGLERHVRLVGPRPQEELPSWYSAADAFALVSSREGCPNALLESLACGLPAVATRVGQIPQILGDPRLGVLLPERSVAATAEGLDTALSKTWDRAEIRRLLERHSWTGVARRVQDVFDRAVAEYRPTNGTNHRSC